MNIYSKDSDESPLCHAVNISYTYISCVVQVHLAHPGRHLTWGRRQIDVILTRMTRMANTFVVLPPRVFASGYLHTWLYTYVNGCQGPVTTGYRNSTFKNACCRGGLFWEHINDCINRCFDLIQMVAINGCSIWQVPSTVLYGGIRNSDADGFRLTPTLYMVWFHHCL